jgi:5-methylcytosine-specific restriction enzyme A
VSRPQRDALRGTRTERGYSNRWLRAAALFLVKHPMCQCRECNGMRLVATVVDHIIPHRGDSELLWDEDNWQAMAASCHSRKTVLEDGGFGRESRIRNKGAGQKSARSGQEPRVRQKNARAFLTQGGVEIE